MISERCLPINFPVVNVECKSQRIPLLQQYLHDITADIKNYGSTPCRERMLERYTAHLATIQHPYCVLPLQNVRNELARMVASLNRGSYNQYQLAMRMNAFELDLTNHNRVEYSHLAMIVCELGCPWTLVI